VQDHGAIDLSFILLTNSIGINYNTFFFTNKDYHLKNAVPFNWISVFLRLSAPALKFWRTHVRRSESKIWEKIEYYKGQASHTDSTWERLNYLLEIGKQTGEVF
jgi:hypothetical protein